MLSHTLKSTCTHICPWRGVARQQEAAPPSFSSTLHTFSFYYLSFLQLLSKVKGREKQLKDQVKAIYLFCCSIFVVWRTLLCVHVSAQKYLLHLLVWVWCYLCCWDPNCQAASCCIFHKHAYFQTCHTEMSFLLISQKRIHPFYIRGTTWSLSAASVLSHNRGFES